MDGSGHQRRPKPRQREPEFRGAIYANYKKDSGTDPLSVSNFEQKLSSGQTRLDFERGDTCGGGHRAGGDGQTNDKHGRTSSATKTKSPRPAKYGKKSKDTLASKRPRKKKGHNSNANKRLSAPKGPKTLPVGARSGEAADAGKGAAGDEEGKFAAVLLEHQRQRIRLNDYEKCKEGVSDLKPYGPWLPLPLGGSLHAHSATVEWAKDCRKMLWHLLAIPPGPKREEAWSEQHPAVDFKVFDLLVARLERWQRHFYMETFSGPNNGLGVSAVVFYVYLGFKLVSMEAVWRKDQPGRSDASACAFPPQTARGSSRGKPNLLARVFSLLQKMRTDLMVDSSLHGAQADDPVGPSPPPSSSPPPPPQNQDHRIKAILVRWKNMLDSLSVAGACLFELDRHSVLAQTKEDAPPPPTAAADKPAFASSPLPQSSSPPTSRRQSVLSKYGSKETQMARQAVKGGPSSAAKKKKPNKVGEDDEEEEPLDTLLVAHRREQSLLTTLCRCHFYVSAHIFYMGGVPQLCLSAKIKTAAGLMIRKILDRYMEQEPDESFQQELVARIDSHCMPMAIREQFLQSHPNQTKGVPMGAVRNEMIDPQELRRIQKVTSGVSFSQHYNTENHRFRGHVDVVAFAKMFQFKFEFSWFDLYFKDGYDWQDNHEVLRQKSRNMRPKLPHVTILLGRWTLLGIGYQVHCSSGLDAIGCWVSAVFIYHQGLLESGHDLAAFIDLDTTTPAWKKFTAKWKASRLEVTGGSSVDDD